MNFNLGRWTALWRGAGDCNNRHTKPPKRKGTSKEGDDESMCSKSYMPTCSFSEEVGKVTGIRQRPLAVLEC